MTKIQIENIIAYAQISKLFDIKLLSEKIAVIVLGTGKIFCTGAKEITDAIDKIKKVTSQIKKIGFKTKKDYKVKIENIIVSTDLKKELNLASLAIKLFPQEVDYQPEVFPGLVYKMDDLQTILIIFNSGKIVCTGAKSIDDATNSIKKMEETLSSIGDL